MTFNSNSHYFFQEKFTAHHNVDSSHGANTLIHFDRTIQRFNIIFVKNHQKNVKNGSFWTTLIFVLKLEATHPVYVYKISRFFEFKTNGESSTDRHRKFGY